MTTLTYTTLPIWAAEMNGESSLPLLYDAGPVSEPSDSNLGEDDGLFLGYGSMRSAFPYRAQDCYHRELSRHGLPAVILENDHLRAAFVPELGGKLWSLFDKDSDRELLFANHVFRPAYLGLRNAWTSGGIEWNCGAMIGHHPHTASPLFTAVLDAETSGLGCPVLRFYTYERIRSVTQQMDFYLPEDSKYLHCRMRVVNDTYETTPMYWWSNIAVKSDPDARCVVPADFAFTSVDGKITRVPVPFRNGLDVSYPMNNPIAIDYFFKTYENHRHYTSHLDKTGYGLVQTSTARLKGRKLFVWGQGQGGRKWQEFLSGDDGHGNYNDGTYCEIQCGLANTQYECIPMPPKTAWEWMEYYGAIHADPEQIHGEWHAAQQELEAKLDQVLPLASLEQELKETHAMATTKADRLLAAGLGWGALENVRRAKEGKPPMSPHLDFGALGEEQAMWDALLRTGSLQTGTNDNPEFAPCSYQRRIEWIRLLETAAAGPDQDFWLTHYMLGCAYLADCKLDLAEAALQHSIRCHKAACNTYAMAELHRVLGNTKVSTELMLAAAEMAPEDASLCKMTAKTLARLEEFEALYQYTGSLSSNLQSIPRIRLYRAIAAEKLGRWEEAEALLLSDGGLEIPDIQEGEIAITELWFAVEEAKAHQNGCCFDRSTARPPKKFDFRMNVAD